MAYCILLVVLLCFWGSNAEPLIIGHRGASGHRPENTLASWERAMDFEADYIEADVVSTKDHVLVTSHNPDITHTTDVADHPEFASRFTKKNISGEMYEGFFIDDFTVLELKSFRTRERYPFRDQSWNDLYPMPTLKEFLTLIKAKEAELGKRFGIYVETKHPSYYRSVGLPLEKLLVDELHIHGYKTAADLVFIQSFETNLRMIKELTEIPLVQLISGTEGDRVQYDTKRKWRDIASTEGLKEVATFASGVGPHKTVIFKQHENGTTTPTTFLKDAHDLGLLVHVWTFRKEREHFEKHEKKLFGTIEEELRVFFDLKVDGVFTDQPDIGVQIKREMYPISTIFEDLNLEVLITVALSIFSALGLINVSRVLRTEKMDADVASTIRMVEKTELSNSH